MSERLTNGPMADAEWTEERLAAYQPPPAGTPLDAAMVALKEALDDDEPRQLDEKPTEWSGFAVALGMWGDALDDAADNLPSVWVPDPDDDAKGRYAESPERLAISNRSKAVRWVERNRRRPYFGTKDDWTWFNTAKVIAEMADHQSDIPDYIFKHMKSGDFKAEQRGYKSGTLAFVGLVDDVAALIAVTGNVPADVGVV